MSYTLSVLPGEGGWERCTVRKAERKDRMAPVGKKAKAAFEELISMKQKAPFLPHADVAVPPPRCVCQGLSNTLPRGDPHWHFKGRRTGPNILETSISCPCSVLPNKGLGGPLLSVITVYEMEGHFGTRIVRSILF